MDASWISPILVGIGVVISLYRDIRRSGRRDQLIDDHATAITDMRRVQEDQQRTLSDHGAELAQIKGVLRMPLRG